MNIVFFGSFQHYSTIIVQSLHNHPDIQIAGVVTTPPMPAGRKKELTPTHTHTWAKQQNIPIFTPNNLDTKSLDTFTDNRKLKIENSNRSIDLFIVAGYGKILPDNWLNHPKHGSLNIHFSLLPDYRGANPAEWALLMGEKRTGISLITMSSKLDAGNIIAQKDIKISDTDTRESLYHKLYTLAGKYSPEMILKYFHWLQKKDANCQTSLTPRKQEKPTTPYARLLKRDDGYLPWTTIQTAISANMLSNSDFDTKLFHKILTYLKNSDQSDYIQLINRSSRALHGYPGLWTTIPTLKGNKRLKIHSTSIYKNKLILEKVQLEGQQPSTFNQIKNSIQS